MSFHIANQGHVVNILPPVDLSGGPLTADRFSMEGWAHASIILTIGANAAGASVGVTVKEANADTAGTANAIVFDYYVEETAAGDTLGAKVTATTAGFDLHASNDNLTYVIEIEASQLTADYHWIELCIADAASTTLGSAVAILSGGRFQSEASATAIA